MRPRNRLMCVSRGRDIRLMRVPWRPQYNHDKVHVNMSLHTDFDDNRLKISRDMTIKSTSSAAVAQMASNGQNIANLKVHVHISLYTKFEDNRSRNTARISGNIICAKEEKEVRS